MKTMISNSGVLAMPLPMYKDYLPLWNQHPIRLYDSMEAAIKALLDCQAVPNRDNYDLNDPSSPIKIVDGPADTKMLLVDGGVYGIMYVLQTYQTEKIGSSISYRAFNIFTGQMEECKHKFTSFDKLVNHLIQSNGFKKHEIVFGKLDEAIKIDNDANATFGVYHIAENGNLAIVGYATVIGDIAELGRYNDIKNLVGSATDDSNVDIIDRLVADIKDCGHEIECILMITYPPLSPYDDSPFANAWPKPRKMVEYVHDKLNRIFTIDDSELKIITVPSDTVSHDPDVISSDIVKALLVKGKLMCKFYIIYKDKSHDDSE